MSDGHHVWCNKQYGHVDECHYCKPRADGTSLWQAHPYGDAKTANELMARDFPQNVPRSVDVPLDPTAPPSASTQEKHDE